MTDWSRRGSIVCVTCGCPASLGDDQEIRALWHCPNCGSGFVKVLEADATNTEEDR